MERLGPSDAELRWWADSEPALAGLGSFDALRADQLDPDVPPERKDARLAALLRLVARCGDGPAEAVLALLVPGMGRRIADWGGSLPCEDAWAEMVAGVLARIGRYAEVGPPGVRVASKLLGAGTKTMVAARDRHRAWGHHNELHARPRRPVGDDGSPTLRRVLDDATAAGAIGPLAAGLIAATRIDGYTLVDAARRAGVSYEAARKRRKAAEAALVAHQRHGAGWL